MEDPRRMRTKLRLDLKDVRRQIEDMEELLKVDKSSENVEAHQKLVDYEEKLKEQYQKMTGLSVDQATNLEGKNLFEEKKTKSSFALLLGFIGGIAIAYGFYNTLLHSLIGYAPSDVIAYFTGEGGSTQGLTVFVSAILYGNSLYLVIGPIGAGAALVFLGSIIDSSKSFFFRFLEGIAFIPILGFFVYIFISGDVTAVTETFQDFFFYFTISVLLSGFLIYAAALGNSGGFSKFTNSLVAIFVIYSGVQFYLLTTIPGRTLQAEEIVYQWPWMITPIIAAAGLYGFIKFIRMLR